MVKAKLNNGDLVFGISEANVEKLKQGHPIVVNLKDMGLEDRKIIITYGETEDKIFEDMLPYIDLDKTKVNL